MGPQAMVATMMTYDYLIAGAGIAGVSIAAELATTHRVILVEMEERPGYHSTARSAASYEPNYGPPPMLALTRASKVFFENPPQGFTDVPLMSPRGTIFFEAEGQEKRTTKLLAHGAGLQEISVAEAQKLYPILRPTYAKRCFRDDATADLDVDVLHRGYLRQFKARGGTLLLASPIKTAEHKAAIWHAICGVEHIQARTIINAAGAWGDVVAQICGAKPIGLQPKRRSVGIIPMPVGVAFEHWPMVTDVGETWYAKPQSGKMIVSSADATPVDPHDAYADDMAIAEGVDRLMTATTLEVQHLDHSWGGLRTFASDGCPVVGFDPHTEGFFWLVGQGGYGIQSSPALSQVAAQMARRLTLPASIMEHGLNMTDIKPERFFQ
jgi:D-arginine dehydrogenase